MLTKMLSKIINAVIYQLGWFSCILGAAYGHPFIGAGFGIVLLAVHLTLAVQRRAEIKLVVISCLLGIIIDSSQQAAGLFIFAGDRAWPFWLPLWIVVIWAQFATVLRFALFWLHGRYLLAALLGAVGGPLAYWSGIRLGVAHFGASPPITLLVLATVWAVVMPLLLWICQLLNTDEGRYRLILKGTL